jgi:adenylate kinase
MKLFAAPQGRAAMTHSNDNCADAASQRTTLMPTSEPLQTSPDAQTRIVNTDAEPLLLAVIGPPGAGKSTVIAALAGTGVPVFRLRETIRAHPHLPATLPPTLDPLGWVSPEAVRRVLRAAFIDRRFGVGAPLVLLDNFPGTAAQLDMLTEVAACVRSRVALMELRADVGTVIARVRQRRVCRSCGPDPHAPATLDGGDPNRCGACGDALTRRGTDSPRLHRQRLARYIANRPHIAERAAERGIPHRAVSADSSPSEVCRAVHHAVSRLIESSEPSRSRP